MKPTASVIGRHPGFHHDINLCGLSPVTTDDVGYLDVSWLSVNSIVLIKQSRSCKKRYQGFAVSQFRCGGALG